MTSTPVTDSLNVQFMNNPGQSPTGVKTASAPFDSFMNMAKSANGTTASEPVRTKEVKKTDDSPNNTEPAITGEEKVSKQGTTQKTVSKEDTEAVKDAVNEVKKAIREAFEVTDEDIETALEELGLNPLALLDTALLPQIVTKLTGSEDTLSLALDENLYEKLCMVTETVSETVNGLAKELGISAEDFTGQLTNFESIAFDENLQKSDVAVSDVAVSNVAVSNVQTEAKPEKLEDKITFSRFERADLSQKESTAQSAELTNVQTKEDGREQSEEFGRSGSNSGFELSGFTQNLLEKVTESIYEDKGISFASMVDTYDVINQITESIDINLAPEASEISLRLHPESLGNVSVKISANNEGVLTAQFIAQNESVKAIIESQAVVLRESLENKGVNVEAVEVLVQSHEFERNLSGQERQQGKENGQKKQTVRRINLSEPADDTESKEDALVKEMMVQNGNTIDYSA